MTQFESPETGPRQTLESAYFPVASARITVGEDLFQSKRFKAIVRTDGGLPQEPFAIVTEEYKLIRNEDAMDLGYEAFEQVFGHGMLVDMSVFNVMLSRTGGSFLADLTAPSLELKLEVPGKEFECHMIFLRVTNSYNRTRAVRIETGVCRSICRNGIIFGEQSIKFRDPHHKTKQELTDEIAKKAKSLEVGDLRRQIQSTYQLPLPNGMNVLEGMIQTLSLTIPPPREDARNSSAWHERCRTLLKNAQNYERDFGKTVFSAIQAASEWANLRTIDSPIQRDSYERRCGEMLQILQTRGAWPDRDSGFEDQHRRIEKWTQMPDSRLSKSTF